MGWIGWQCCLAGSSIMALRIFIFSIILGAEYLSYVKSIAIFVLTFFGYIISVLAIVCFRSSFRIQNIFHLEIHRLWHLMQIVAILSTF